MDELTAFERRFAASLEDYVGPPRTVDADALAWAAAARPPARRSILSGASPAVATRRVPWRLIGVVALLGVSLTAGAIFVGGQPPRLPAVTGPAADRLVAFGRAGDIFVGDPANGETNAIVTGPDDDSTPVFSPDGSLIAFVRGGIWNVEASVVVVRPDGSDERVVMPAGFGERGGIAFAWTPDSASLVINHDSRPFTTPYWDGELTLFDVFGRSEPRPLTPPLPIGPGGPYLDAHAPFAQMFRPPNADAILSGGTNALSVWDIDLERTEELVPAGLDYGYWTVCAWCVTWSPDGSKISFGINLGPNSQLQALESFVMEADGTNVREIPNGAWSPDSTRMAFERCSKDPARPGSTIVVVDVTSGAERTLEATAVNTKTEGNIPRSTVREPRPPDLGYCGWFSGPDGRSWDYEGWSWTSDGSSIVFLERAGTHPTVVDIETGIATELPWVVDSAPSWQPIARD